jgi:hypothetical protein
MALLGTGVLAIWNGIVPSAEDEFIAWHVREHIPERVGLPGFLRGRRYVAIDGKPKYFNFYETTDTGALISDAYRARLNAPTDWTRAVVAHFTDTSRTVCDVAASFGLGEGAFVDTIRLSASADAAAFKTAIAGKILQPVSEEPGIVGAYLLQGQRAATGGDTAEKKLRGQPDEVADWVVLIEAVEQGPIETIRRAAASNDAFVRHGASPAIERGLYRLQFALTKTEMEVTRRV